MQPPSVPAAVLSIWHDYAPDKLDAFERWYLDEHFDERLSAPGFLRIRRHEAVAADRKFFTAIDLAGPEVCFTPAYLAQAGNPSPWTREIMSGWQAMLRTICARVARSRPTIGAHVVAARWSVPVALAPDMAQRLHAALADAAGPGIAAVDIWTAAPLQIAPSAESLLRAPDAHISGAVIVEATRPTTIARAALALPGLLAPLPAPSSIGHYSLIAMQDAMGR